VERFLEKPSWGQVFSDTINTGIYVIEPEALSHVPTDRPYDFSKQLFPLLLEMGRPIYGHVLDGYWQDIGNLDQYRQANFDALDETVRLNIDGVRLRGNVWIGEGADIHDAEEIEGPAFIGNHCRIARDASVGPYTVLSNGVTLRERARTVRTVIDSSTHVGRSALIEGAVVGSSCDIRDHVRIQEGAAIGDEVTIGSESSIMPHVRIYPYKEVETGSQLYENLIWETRASSRLFGKDGVTGLVNVDVNPETAARLATALGTALKRGARVVASRDSAPSCRMIKRSMISGLNAAGLDVADLRVSPPAVSRHVLKTQGFAAAVHVGVSQLDPEAIFIRIYEPPGILLTQSLQAEIEKNFTRQELRRVAAGAVGSVSYPARVRESYAQDLLESIDVDAARARRFRIVVDYGYSASSFVLPLVAGPMGVEAISAHGFFAEELGDRETLAQAVGHTKRLVTAIGADLGAVFDQSGERLYLIDEQGREVPVDQTLLLYVHLLAQRGTRGRAAFPNTVTTRVDELAGDVLEVVRTRNSLSELTSAAAEPGVVFAGAVGGGYVFPDFLPAYDAVASLAKLLELLAPVGRPLSELVAELPEPTLIHRRLACPWAKKGLVMRVLNERLAGRDLDLMDGIKLRSERGWAQVLPDPDEPLVHIYAEGESPQVTDELEQEVRELVEEIMQGDSAVPRTSVKASS
jgi:mannose-1-phosphate guanylyltransferase/phosphomannomutase